MLRKSFGEGHMPKIEIIHYSGTGRTTKIAELIAEASGGRVWTLGHDGVAKDVLWDAVDAADMLVFGSPTYMGGPAWQFKRFADATGNRWYDRAWQDKLCGGFTVSSSTNGDKGECLSYFMTLAGQHGMIWVSLGQASPPSRANPDSMMNWTGGNTGLMTISGRDGFAEGDILSAQDYGARLRNVAERFAPDR